MIDILEFNEAKKEIVYTCRHCSDQVGHWVKTVKHIGKKSHRHDQFIKDHVKCGVEEEIQADKEFRAKCEEMFPKEPDFENRVKWVMEHEEIGYVYAKARYIIYWRSRWKTRPLAVLPESKKSFSSLEL